MNNFIRIDEYAEKQNVSVDSLLIEGALGNLNVWGLLSFEEDQLPIQAYPLLVSKGYEFYLDAHRKMGGTIENMYQIPEIEVYNDYKQRLTTNDFVCLPTALLRNFVEEPDEFEFLTTCMKFKGSVTKSWRNSWFLNLKDRYRRVDPKLDHGWLNSVEKLPDLSALLWLEPAAKIKKENLFVRHNSHNVSNNLSLQDDARNLDELDSLLIKICGEKNRSIQEVWKLIKREMQKTKREYDKKMILKNFIDDRKQTFMWGSGNKEKPCKRNSVANRMSKLRKNNLIL